MAKITKEEQIKVLEREIEYARDSRTKHWIKETKRIDNLLDSLRELDPLNFEFRKD